MIDQLNHCHFHLRELPIPDWNTDKMNLALIYTLKMHLLIKSRRKHQVTMEFMFFCPSTRMTCPTMQYDSGGVAHRSWWQRENERQKLVALLLAGNICLLWTERSLSLSILVNGSIWQILVWLWPDVMCLSGQVWGSSPSSPFPFWVISSEIGQTIISRKNEYLEHVMCYSCLLYIH